MGSGERRRYLLRCLDAFLKAGFERTFYDSGKVDYWGPQSKKKVDSHFDTSRTGVAEGGPTGRPSPAARSSMSAFSIDDPMLALIARFAACCTDHRMSEDAFLRHQYDQIRAYVGDVPEDQRQERALEWIVHNAEEYRRKWHRKVAAEAAPDSRCPDCPLEGQDDAKTCEIHERWLGLLNEYLAGAISSRAYVVDTLNLLRDHKEQLKSRAVQLATF